MSHGYISNYIPNAVLMLVYNYKVDNAFPFCSQQCCVWLYQADICPAVSKTEQLENNKIHQK